MTRLFDRSVRQDEAASKLAQLRQEGRSVTEYTIQFKTLAASCNWNEGALRAMFREGLNFEIQDEIATPGPGGIYQFGHWSGRPHPLASVMLGSLLVLGAGGNPAFQGPPTTSINPAWSWAHAVGVTSIVCRRETTKSGAGPLPLLWEAGPLCSIVSFKSQNPLVNQGVLVGVSPLISPQSRTQLSAKITYQDSVHSCKALIDSGAEANFLDCSTAKSWASLPFPSPLLSLSGASLVIMA